MTTASLSSWISLAKDALTLKPEPFQRLASPPASLRSAIAIVVVVGLLIGGVHALVGIPGLVSAPQFNADEFVGQIEESLSMSQMFGGAQTPEEQEAMALILESIRRFAPTIEKLSQVQTPLPGFFVRLLQWLGDWLSRPFARLASWLFISVWIMLFARLLGGQGNLLPYLSASALSTIPHLLHAFDFIPCLGAIIWLVAGVWGLVIQVKAVEITHGLSQGKSILAVALPYLLVFLLAGVLFLLSILLIAFGANA
ncbi:MAG TPA: YIP1 family protein [Caldilineae bacterium]|nr:YIP1 family protein [Caldilineae bacterium]